jgi:hypothetical protein
MSSQKPEKRAPSIWQRLFPDFFEPPVLDARPGANRWVWNLRLADASIVDDAVIWGSAAGPMAPPGSYRARMTAGDWSETVGFEVVADPRQDLDQGAIGARYTLARAVWAELSRSHDLVRELREVREQVVAWSGRADIEEVSAMASDLINELDDIEGRLRQTRLESSQDMLNFPPKLDNQLVYLKEVVEKTPGFPTAATLEYFAKLRTELEGIENDLHGVLSDDVPKLEAMLETAGVPRIGIECAESSTR